MVQLPSDRHRPPSTPDDGIRLRGRVRWFNQILGVGQVRVPGRGHLDLYYKDIRHEGYRALDAGDEVSFWIEETDRGPVVRDVWVERSLPRE